jgi:allantoinase
MISKLFEQEIERLMEQVDVNVTDGLIVTRDGSFRGSISVHSGKIAAFGDAKILPKAKETIDATGYLILPGLVDPHFHSRVPGFPNREDFRTASMAAAAGGVTTFLDMPNSIPPINSIEVLKEKIDIGEKESCMDFGIIAGGGSDNLNQIPLLAKEGVVGFKTFLHAAPQGREAEFKGLCAEHDGVLLDVLKTVARSESISFIHAENAQITQFLMDGFKSKGDCSVEAFFLSRPPIAEIESVSKTLCFAAETHVPLHLCHISTGGAMELIKHWKEKGLNVSAETCPHYLVLTQDEIQHLGPYAKNHPPVRGKKDVEALWKFISDGTVDMVGSDHCPYEAKEKEAGLKDIWAAPAGAPNVEWMLPLMLDQLNKGKLSIQKLVELMCENPARRFRLFPKKGIIQVGSDADLVIVDMKAKKRISWEQMFTKGKATARLYEGREIQGLPVMTMVRGRIVFRRGKIEEGSLGWGKFVRPQA